MLDTYLRDHGVPAVVEEVIDDYPSPLLLIGGMDAVTQQSVVDPYELICASAVLTTGLSLMTNLHIEIERLHHAEYAVHPCRTSGLNHPPA